jgi:hypothetical protein
MRLYVTRTQRDIFLSCFFFGSSWNVYCRDQQFRKKVLRFIQTRGQWMWCGCLLQGRGTRYSRPLLPRDLTSTNVYPWRCLKYNLVIVPFKANIGTAGAMALSLGLWKLSLITWYVSSTWPPHLDHILRRRVSKQVTNGYKTYSIIF